MSARFPYLPSAASLRRDSRGVSEVLGVVLLVGIVVVATASLTLYGNAAVASNEERVDVERATKGLQQLDNRASRVALGESDVQRLDVGVAGTGGSLDSRPDDGWMRVSIVNATTGVDDAVVVNQTLGAVVYEHGDTTVAYQGGGVWRSDGDSSTMVSRPEFHNRNDTLTLPIVVTGGDGALYSDVRVRPDGQVVKKFPNESANLTNKIQETKVRVTVQSDYYLGWGEYFEKHTSGHVTYDHARETVSVTFLSLPNWFGLDSGIVATSGSGEIRLGGNSIYIDSYDSSLGSYSDTQSANGSITAINDVVSTGSSNVQGDVTGGNAVDLSGTTDISGTVYWGESYSQGGASVSGGDEQIPGVATIEPIDGYVENTVADARVANNNSEVSVIDSNDELTGSGTLTAGTYYLDHLTLGPGDTLTIDTSDGDVVVAVENTVTIDGKGQQDSKAARIDVIGPGNATVFVRGDDATDFEMGSNSQVDVPVENSGQFRVYGTSDFDAAITSDNSPAQIRFEGVIYAPAGLQGSGSVTIGQAEFFGAIVAGDLTVKQNAKIHYDEGLADERFPRSPTLTRLEYVHVSVHPIEVTAD